MPLLSCAHRDTPARRLKLDGQSVRQHDAPLPHLPPPYISPLPCATLTPLTPTPVAGDHVLPEGWVDAADQLGKQRNGALQMEGAKQANY